MGTRGIGSMQVRTKSSALKKIIVSFVVGGLCILALPFSAQAQIIADYSKSKVSMGSQDYIGLPSLSVVSTVASGHEYGIVLISPAGDAVRFRLNRAGGDYPSESEKFYLGQSNDEGQSWVRSNLVGDMLTAEIDGTWTVIRSYVGTIQSTTLHLGGKKLTLPYSNNVVDVTFVDWDTGQISAYRPMGGSHKMYTYYGEFGDLNNDSQLDSQDSDMIPGIIAAPLIDAYETLGLTNTYETLYRHCGQDSPNYDNYNCTLAIANHPYQTQYDINDLRDSLYLDDAYSAPGIAALPLLVAYSALDFDNAYNYLDSKCDLESPDYNYYYCTLALYGHYSKTLDDVNALVESITYTVGQVLSGSYRSRGFNSTADYIDSACNSASRTHVGCALAVGTHSTQSSSDGMYLASPWTSSAMDLASLITEYDHNNDGKFDNTDKFLIMNDVLETLGIDLYALDQDGDGDFDISDWNAVTMGPHNFDELRSNLGDGSDTAVAPAMLFLVGNASVDVMNALATGNEIDVLLAVAELNVKLVKYLVGEQGYVPETLALPGNTIKTTLQ